MPTTELWSEEIKKNFEEKRIRFTNGNITLWRYMSLPRLNQLLAGEAWFSSVLSLRGMNDPFEGEGMVLPSEIDAALQKQDELSQFLVGREEHAEGHRAVGFAEGFAEPTLDGTERFLDWSAKARCAWCWFSAEHESHGMWKNYGKQGVVVETTAERLIQVLPQEHDFLIGDVRYVDPRPAHDQSTLMIEPANLQPYILRPYLLKRLEYRDEHEIRVVSRCVVGIDGACIKLTAPEKLIRTIKIYPTADRSLFNAIRDSVVAMIKARFPGLGEPQPSPDGSLSIGINGNSIAITSSSMQSALYRQSESSGRFAEDFARLLNPVDKFPI
jgi:hypothetical protein